MIGELDAPLSPLVEDASPWIEYCSQQISQTRRQKAKEIKRPGNSRLTGLSGGKTLINGEIRMARGTMAPRGPISLRAPRICRTIQASRVVERVPGLSLLESNAVAPGTMDSYRRAVTDFELCASEIGQHLDWKNGVEIEGTCLEYLPEVGNRLMAAIGTFLPLQPSWRSRHAKDSESSERVDETDAANESMALAVDKGVAAALFSLWRRRKPVVAPANALSYAWPTFVLARQTDQEQRVSRDVFLLLFERKKVAPQARLTLSTSR